MALIRTPSFATRMTSSSASSPRIELTLLDHYLTIDDQ
jgi:hypothetical protein